MKMSYYLRRDGSVEVKISGKQYQPVKLLDMIYAELVSQSRDQGVVKLAEGVYMVNEESP